MKLKFYDSYICLIEFNSNAISNLKYLLIGMQNTIAKNQLLTTGA